MNMKVILGIGAIVLIGAAVLGFVNAEQLIMRARYVFFGAKGAVSQVATVNAGQSTGTPAQAEACRGLLTLIQNGKRRAAADRGQAVGSVTWEEVLFAMNRLPQRGNNRPAAIQAAMPVCPAGGKYDLGPLHERPTCSIGGNASVAPDDDHIIRN